MTAGAGAGTRAGAVLLCNILNKMYNLGLKNWKQLNVYLSIQLYSMYVNGQWFVMVVYEVTPFPSLSSSS